MPPIFPILLSVSVSFAAVDIAFALTQFEITLLTCTHTQVRVRYPYSTLAHTLAQHHHYYIVANALCSSCMCNAIKIDTSKNYSDYTWAVGNRKQLYCEHKCTAAHLSRDAEKIVLMFFNMCAHHLTQYRRQPNEHSWNTKTIVALYSFLHVRCPNEIKRRFFISLCAIKHLSILIFHTFVHTSVMILSISNVFQLSVCAVLYVHGYRIMSLFVELLFNIEMFHRYFPLIRIAIVRRRRNTFVAKFQKQMAKICNQQ